MYGTIWYFFSFIGLHAYLSSTLNLDKFGPPLKHKESFIFETILFVLTPSFPVKNLSDLPELNQY